VSWICLKGQISVKRSIGLSNHHETLTPKTPHNNKPSHKNNLPVEGGTTACNEGPATPLRCRDLLDPRSVLRKGTTGFKEGITGSRRGPAGNNQGGQQQKHLQQRIRHPQHPHNSKQIKQGPGSKVMKRLICHKGRLSCCHKEAEHCHKEARHKDYCHKEAADHIEQSATSLRRKENVCKSEGGGVLIYTFRQGLG
jgi:hypothetical protein